MKTRLKQYLIAVVALFGMLGSRVWAANTGTTDATITVTPVANVSMSLTPSSYDFGNLSVNTSSVSAAGMQLNNTGDITVAVTKQITTDAGNWIADTSSSTVDHYMLFVATSTARPAIDGSDFTVGNHLIGKSMTNGGSASNLLGLGGGNPTIASAGNEMLWYRLDMPKTVDASAQRSMIVRFTGTAQ